MDTNKDTEPTPVTTYATGATVPSTPDPNSFFQKYIDQIQIALQKQIESGASADEVGKKIFSSILSALEPDNTADQNEGREIHTSFKPNVPQSEGVPPEVTDFVPPTATTAPLGEDDDSAGVLVTAPPMARSFLDVIKEVGRTVVTVADKVGQGVLTGVIVDVQAPVSGPPPGGVLSGTQLSGPQIDDLRTKVLNGA